MPIAVGIVCVVRRLSTSRRLAEALPDLVGRVRVNEPVDPAIEAQADDKERQSPHSPARTAAAVGGHLERPALQDLGCVRRLPDDNVLLLRVDTDRNRRVTGQRVIEEIAGLYRDEYRAFRNDQVGLYFEHRDG